MKKPIIILLLLLSTLSMAYAIYEGRSVEKCQVKANKTEIRLNEKIRQLEDSLLYLVDRLKAEKKIALEAKKVAEDLSMRMEERLKGSK